MASQRRFDKVRSRTRPRSAPERGDVFSRSLSRGANVRTFFLSRPRLKHGRMFKTKEALIPYLLLVAALAGGVLWHESESVPGLGRTVVSGQIAVGGGYSLIDQDGKPR